MIVLFDRITMSPYLERASGLVAPAAFTAAVIAVLGTGSPQAAILAGMPALRVATALLPT